MRTLTTILLALLVIGIVATLGVTGVLNTIATGWMTVTGGTQ